MSSILKYANNCVLKARGGVKVDFPVFTYLIRAAGDEQEEKNWTEI